MKFLTTARLLVSLALPAGSACAAVSPRILLWPGQAPGETQVLPPEADLTKPTDAAVGGRPVVRWGNVSSPTITIYSPAPERNTGAAVVVCPGGGYHILALDLEGTEVCAWLNSIGVTAVLLKYRVPRRVGRERHAAPLQDVQRAMGLVRQRADELGVDVKRVGVLGFSAGGHLAAVLSNNHTTRTYEEIDEADKLSCRPDFAVLVYPGYLTAEGKAELVAPELPVSAMNTAPTFIAMAEDDTVHVETGLFYYVALKRAKVPAEMHVYPRGGHGYGLRRTENDVTTWPDRAADWMRASGWLKPTAP